MAQASTLYRFRIVTPFHDDKNHADKIDIRVAKHPSESNDYLLTRVIAYALNYEDGLEFTVGLSNPDEPAIRLLDSNGNVEKWFDIGNPSARRLHKAAKAADVVKVYTYKDAQLLIREVAGETIYQKEKIEIFSIDSVFLEALVEALARDNEWILRVDGEEVEVDVGDDTYVGALKKHSLK